MLGSYGVSWRDTATLLCPIPSRLPCCPAGRQLPGAERASPATAEETDIDAVEVPLPGSDGLDFSRGVTDLDAVRKDGASHTDSKVGRGARSRQGDRVPGLLTYPVHPETQPASRCHPALSPRWRAASSPGAESAPSGGPSVPVLCLSSWRPCPGVVPLACLRASSRGRGQPFLQRHLGSGLS